MIDALDVASLEQFQLELVNAGFEPQDEVQRVWVGPIADSLRPFTAEQTMRIVFFDGWPFQHPRLFVDGIDQHHVNAAGDVCLWATGAAPEGWRKLDAYMKRIDEWAAHTETAFRPEDFALDAHRYFIDTRSNAIATVDLASLRLSETKGGRGGISGTWNEDEHILQIASGLKGSIEGRWYFVGGVDVPPRTLEAVRALLDNGQRANFDRRYNAVVDGKARLFMVIWNRDLGRETLVLLAQRGEDGEIKAEAIEVAPTDAEYLRLRAGPDVDTLAERSVVLFGAGAVGSHTGLLLAEAGVGTLVVVDGDHLRPSNLVRHAATSSVFVGESKARLLAYLAHQSAPWTRVVPVDKSSWAPTQLRGLLKDADAAVDATGNASFSSLLSYLCAEATVPLASVALYRGGAVGRVRRQGADADVAFGARTEASGYRTIPPGDEPLNHEPGCSSPVNNASPVVVTAIAATAAEVVIDLLSGRLLHPDEIIDIYRPLEEAPFDMIGRPR